MSSEIEYKFIVGSDLWRDIPPIEVRRITQGYITNDNGKIVRVRLYSTDSEFKAYITIKTPAEGIKRGEYEYPIPVDDAREMLDLLCESILDKTRTLIKHDGMVWEVDEFHGLNEGLVLAELEVESEDTKFTKPEWVLDDVSTDLNYTSSNLSNNCLLN